MKKCGEKWKLKKAVISAKNELKSIFPLPANGRALTKKNREDIRKLRQKILDCEEKYRRHVENCIICNS